MAARTVALIVRTEVRRRMRSILDAPGRGLGYAISGLVGVAFAIGMSVGGFFLGRALAAGALGDPRPAGASIAASVVALAAFMTTLRAVQRSAMPPGRELLLVAAPTRAVVTSLLVVEALLPLSMIGLPGVLASLTFAAGAGSPASAPLLAASALLLVGLGATIGFALGLLVRTAIARSRVLARHKGALGVLSVLAYVGIVFGSGAQNVLAPAVRLLGATPVGWVADLGLLAVVPSASPLRAVGALLVTGIAVVALWAGSVRLAGRLWFEPPVSPRTHAAASSLGRLPGVDRTTDHVVRKTWTRARRAPIRLVYVIYPLFAAIGPVASSLGGGVVPAVAAPTIAIYGAWATGAAFTLNPIGDETPVLPVTLTSPVTGRRFVRALWLAGAAVGVPLTLVLAEVAGVLAGLAPSGLLLVGALALGLPALAPGIAAGIGATVPRLQPARVARSRRAVVPSLLAFGGYSLVLLPLAAPAWLATGGPLARTVGDRLGASPWSVAAAGAAGSLLAVGVLAVLGARHAAGRFDRYTLD